MKKKINILFILIILLNCQSPSQVNNNGPKAVKGVLDLSNTDFNKAKEIRLGGEWEFFPGCFLSYEEYRNREEPGYINVPGSFYGYKNRGKTLRSTGYATYALKVVLPASRKKNPALMFYSIRSSAKIFINGKQILLWGKPGESRKDSLPACRPMMVDLQDDSAEIIILVHLSNFHNKIGGIINTPVFGSREDLVHKRVKTVAYELFLTGSILISGLYHLSLFLNRRKNRAFFHFSLFCLFALTRQITVGEIFISTLIPSIPFQVVTMISYISFFACVYGLYSYLGALYPKEIHNPNRGIINKAVIAISLFCSLLVLLGDVLFSSYVFLIYQFFAILVCIYLAGCLIFIVRRRREGAYILLFSFIFLFSATINDIMLDNSLIVSIYLVPMGLFIFLFAQLYLLSRKLSRSYNRDEQLLKRLRTLSIQLRRKNKRLIALDNLKDEFLANTSHELRTPVHGIVGIADSLINKRDFELPDDVRYNLSLVVSSGNRLSHLIDDITDFSKLRTGNIGLNRKAVNMHQIAEITIQLLSAIKQGSPLKLINHVPGNFPLVYGDEDRLLQIMHNLIGNAIKFTQLGSVTISAGLEKKQAVIVVADTGIGIPGNIQEEIFDSFKQVEGHDSRRFGGTGLGLAITKNLVELHGGRIRVESEPCRGTSFFFTLPLYDKTVSKMSPTGAGVLNPFQEDQASFNRRKTDVIRRTHGNSDYAIDVLIADDEPVNRQVLINYLQNSSTYNIRTSSSGDEVLRIVLEDPPDILLLDIMMPGLSGYDVCRELRKKYPKTVLPVIMVTARNSIADKVRAFNLGINDYLPKPFNREELLMRLDSQAEVLKLRKKELAIQKQLYHADRLIQLGTSLAEVSHEINNYNSVIKLTTEGLRKRFQYLKPILEEYYDSCGDFSLGDAPYSEIRENDELLFIRILMGAEKIQTLIRNIKTFASNESGYRDDVDIKAALEQAMEMCSARLNKRAVKVSMFLEAKLPPVTGNSQYLVQVFTNLLNNALDALPQSDGCIKISAGHKPREEQMVLMIEDNGEGIETENLDRIVEPFFTTKRDEGGTGLGLSLVLKIIHNHKGLISFESQKGEGTVVTITLPAGRAAVIAG